MTVAATQKRIRRRSKSKRNAEPELKAFGTSREEMRSTILSTLEAQKLAFPGEPHAWSVRIELLAKLVWGQLNIDPETLGLNRNGYPRSREFISKELHRLKSEGLVSSPHRGFHRIAEPGLDPGERTTSTSGSDSSKRSGWEDKVRFRLFKEEIVHLKDRAEPGESRHKTARRLIREALNGSQEPQPLHFDLNEGKGDSEGEPDEPKVKAPEHKLEAVFNIGIFGIQISQIKFEISLVSPTPPRMG